MKGLSTTAVALFLGGSVAFAQENNVRTISLKDNPFIDPQTGGTPAMPMDVAINNAMSFIGKPGYGKWQYLLPDGRSTYNEAEVQGVAGVQQSWEFDESKGLPPMSTAAQAYTPSEQFANNGIPSREKDGIDGQSTDPSGAESMANTAKFFDEGTGAEPDSGAEPQGDAEPAERTGTSNGLNVTIVAGDKAQREAILEALKSGFGLNDPPTKAWARTEDFLQNAGGSGRIASAGGQSEGSSYWTEFSRLVGINNSFRTGAGSERPAVAGYGENESLPVLGACRANAPTAFGSQTPDCPPKI